MKFHNDAPLLLAPGSASAAAILLAAWLLFGCYVKRVVKSELSTYAEPVDGSGVRSRLIGSRSVKVYPKVLELEQVERIGANDL